MSKLDTDKSSWLFRGRKSSAVTMVGRMRSRGFGGIMFGGAIICIVIMMALFAPLIAPHDPYHQDLTRRLVPPFWYESGSLVHPFGTDHLGRDYLSRVV